MTGGPTTRTCFFAMIVLSTFGMTHTTNREKDTALGYLLLRATIGTNIFMHGLSRILAGSSHFADALIPAFQHTPLPAGFLRLFALSLPWAQSIIGMLVLVGIKTRLALVAGSFLILTLPFGATLNQDWESVGLQLIYATVYASLLAFRHHNTFSADGLLQRIPSEGEPV
jgi:thiosulfate dehydrogenase [quinone] large subunit